jgi:hypothetical protein
MIPHRSRYLNRIFLGTAACAAQLFDAAVDRFIAEGFATNAAIRFAHSEVRFDLDPELTQEVQSDHDRAVLHRCWSVDERAPSPQEKSMPAPALATTRGNVIESVVTKGDLSKLTADERTAYYMQLCHSLGLNPHTQPFAYITLSGKLTLYAKRDAADQMRKINGVSIEIVEQKISNDLLTVRVRAKDRDGRVDEDYGAVAFPDTLKGEARANMVLKAITKAKRRVTLSICGLGFLDETEVEDIPRRPAPRQIESVPTGGAPDHDAETGEVFEDEEEPTTETLTEHEAALAEAAKGGTSALKEAWKAVPKAHRTVLKGVLDTRLKPIAEQADEEAD